MAIPTIPPRPTRTGNRSVSPSKDAFAPSPLIQTFSVGGQSTPTLGLYGNEQNLSSSSLPQRPPSVTLPSIGQEGDEYANVFDAGADASDGASAAGPTSPRETRNVGDDVKLYAPKPGLPTSSAKARIATVTRTDSQQAAAAGIGKAHGDDRDPENRALKARASFASQESTASTERPPSGQAGENEQGIPEIGQRVPMYPNAGDVQAPSPAPFAQVAPAGIGFHNDGTARARHHGRTRSGREQFLPPDSYGLHGHGTPVQDRFEKAWYEKHPEALEREEHGEYGPGIGGGRSEFALSSDDLNKIVRDTASRGAGPGTHPGRYCQSTLTSPQGAPRPLRARPMSRLATWPRRSTFRASPLRGPRRRRTATRRTSTRQNRTSSHPCARRAFPRIQRGRMTFGASL